tara:strand:- start:465 stop:683 length:219 start_codon:yes stop_codon:yes gene_type:complete
MDFNNIRLTYKGYEISIAQHRKGDEVVVSEVALKEDGNWEVVDSFYGIADLQSTLRTVMYIIDGFKEERNVS